MTDPGFLGQWGLHYLGFLNHGNLRYLGLLSQGFALFGPHWHCLEALTQVGALNGWFLGYAMRPSGVDLAQWCQSRLLVSIRTGRASRLLVSIAPSSVDLVCWW